jgi:signal transduction histidine kinase
MIRRRSLRLRITAGALALVAGLLCGAGLLVIAAVQREMTGQIDAALRADADFTQRLLISGSGLPTAEGPTDLYVQFVGPDGRVMGAGTAAAGRPALASPNAGATTIVDATDEQLGDLRVLSTPVPNNPKVTLVLARSSSTVTAVHDTLVRLLAGLIVVGSVLLGCLVWFVVGRALRPVDEMRRTVDALDDRDLQTRIDSPRTGDELERLADTLNDLLSRLEQAVDREHQFIADASHELRTPIAGLRAVLETEAADPSLVVLTRADALARLDQLRDLVEQLLALERTDAQEPSHHPVDLDELVLGQARQLARTTTLRIDTSRVSGGQVAGRDTDLARVVENLATNAARYARSTVALSVAQAGETVEFVVADDGPGIDVADRARIFERFATLDDARGPKATEAGGEASDSTNPTNSNNSSDRAANEHGAGLGLSIVAAIVARHGGRVDVEDNPGGGARFVVRLPAFVPAAPDRSSAGRHRVRRAGVS